MNTEKTKEATDIKTDPVDSKLTEGVDKMVEKIDASIEVPTQLEPVLAYLTQYPWLKGVVVLCLFVIVAWIVTWIVKRFVARIALHTSSKVDDLIASNLSRPLFWTFTLLGLLVAASLSGVSENAQNILTSVALSILIFLWMLFGLRIAKLLISVASDHAQKRSLVRPQTLPLFTNLANITIIILAIYFIFQVWHIDMTAWLASAGIAGIAIGFAAKDTLANLFSGVFIMADSPYKIGDFIVIDDGTGLRGKVTHIGIRSTRVLTRDDIEVTIPNSIMGNSKVINESGGPNTKSRISVAVGVGYGSDIDKVNAVLQSVAENSSQICTYPVPRVRFRRFGPSALDFELLCWIENPELRGRVIDRLNSDVYQRFMAEGIEIPFSKQDVYIKEMPGTDGSVTGPNR